MEVNVDAIVREQIEQMDLHQMVRESIAATIEKDVKQTIAKEVTTQLKSRVELEINNEFEKAVETDDGWGKRQKYDSFETLFRQSLKYHMDNSYEVKRTIEKLINARVSSLINQEFAKVFEKMVDELTKSKLVKPA